MTMRDALTSLSPAFSIPSKTNADIANVLNADIARRLDVLDKLAGISSKSPQLDAELETLNREYDEATARANNPLGSLLDFLTNGRPFGGS